MCGCDAVDELNSGVDTAQAEERGAVEKSS